MASSLGIRYGAGGGATCSVDRCKTTANRGSPIASLNVSWAMNGSRKSHVISMSLSTSRANIDLEPKRRHEQSVSYENVIDKWMKDSVVEIVKNLREAPLLVQVFSDDGEGCSTRLKTDKAAPEDWPLVKSKWEDGKAPLPEGVIFVEQLKESEVDESDDSGGDSDVDVTRAWGIVVQAKEENCWPACYLLKTSRAGSGPGMGMCCTHFCLVKVKSFWGTAEAQFRDCWLLNALRN